MLHPVSMVKAWVVCLVGEIIFGEWKASSPAPGKHWFPPGAVVLGAEGFELHRLHPPN